MTGAWHEGHIMAGYLNDACPSCQGEARRHPANEGTRDAAPGLREAINDAFDAVMDERRDGLVVEAASDRLLERIIAIRVAAGIR